VVEPVSEIRVGEAPAEALDSPAAGSVMLKSSNPHHQGMMMKSLPALVLVSAALLGSAGTAFAGNAGNVPSLQPCVAGKVADGACLLAVKNGDFATMALSSWDRVGLPIHGVDADGKSYAALPLGSAIRQAVYAHTGTSSADAVYTLRFRIRAEHVSANVRASLSMSTGQGTDTVPLGHVTSMATSDEWSTVELSVQGRPYAAPAHVQVVIENEGGLLATVQVDDVMLIESNGAELLDR
jgi:hypothetical protein